MECLRGKRTFTMNRSELLGAAKTFRGVHLDLGTGDGRYACAIARKAPDYFSIGIDACRENLRRPSRRAPGNALFVIANALCLPRELEGLASRVSILFPWGSLLNSMLNADPALLRGLCMATGYRASIEVWVNAGAMAECGWGLEPGTRACACDPGNRGLCDGASAEAAKR